MVKLLFADATMNEWKPVKKKVGDSLGTLRNALPKTQ